MFLLECCSWNCTLTCEFFSRMEKFCFDFYFIVGLVCHFWLQRAPEMPDILNAQTHERLLFYVMERSPKELFDRIPGMCVLVYDFHFPVFLDSQIY